MKPAPFEYAAPSELAEVTAFLAEYGSDARLLAGGQSLMPVLNMRLSRPGYLVDLNPVDGLGYIRAEGDILRIGAMTRHDDLLRSDAVRESCPLLWAAIPYIGHTAIRYRGTIGGSIVHADPSAEIPAVVVTLGAELVLTSSNGVRTVSAEDFFLTYFTTATEATEVLTEIRFPVQPPSAGVAVRELARRHGDFALAGVAVAAEVGGEGFGDVRVCAFGIDEVPRRLGEVERLVSRQSLSDELANEAARLASAAVSPETDMHATAEYRAEMTGVLAARALRDAIAPSEMTDRGDENHG